MTPRTRLVWFLTLGAASTLALFGGPARSAAQPAHSSVPPARATFLRVAAALAPPAPGPPAPLLGLPTSVFPLSGPVVQCSTNQAGVICSVDTSTPSPGWCSARCNSQDLCSVFLGPSDGDSACSTEGGVRTACSVLPDPGNGGTQAICSTINTIGDGAGRTIACSVLGSGRKQFCSVANPSPTTDFQDICSALFAQSTDTYLCSVLLGNNQFPNFCSSIFADDDGFSKLCSVVAGERGQCSILPSQNGVCSTLKQADPGSCSIHFGPSMTAHCSVIGGAGPNPAGICRP